jgi:hypothetical protein
MGTNFYRVLTESEIISKKNDLIRNVQAMDISIESIESGFKTVSPRKEWEWFTPWEIFIEDTNIHLGKRSMGWKFCWNFHDNKYYSCKDELLDFIRLGRVVDEYGEEQDVEEFITMALEWGEPNGLVVNEEYRRKKRLNGMGSFFDNPKYDDKIIDGLRVSSSTDFC